MNDPLPYATPSASADDDGQLRLLSILHYVWGSLVILFSSIFVFHIVLGILIVKGRGLPLGAVPTPTSFPTSRTNAVPPAALGYVMAMMGGCAVLMGWAFGILTIVSGRRITQRRSRVFSIVIAAVNCISFPFGTALGVFTIIVLSKDSVKAIYFA